MVKRKLTYNILFISLFIMVITISLIVVIEAKLPNDLTYTITDDLAISNSHYDSSLYTNMDDLTESIGVNEIKETDILISTSSNRNWELYFNETRCLFKIRNTLTGYIYASAVEEVSEKSSTNFYAGLLSSSFYIEYYQYNTTKGAYNENVLSSWLMKATALTKKQKEELGLQEEYNYQIGLAPATVYKVTSIDNGIKVEVTYANATELSTDKTYSLGIKVNYYVTIDNDGLHVEVPHDEITESSEYRLANIVIMPLLGGTKQNETAGYMVVPDGCGALLRYGSIIPTEASQQTMPFYHSNEGQSTTLYNYNLANLKNLSAPIFGLINGIKQNGIYGIIDKGSYLASLVISPAGSYNMNYNYLTCKFTKRYFYLLYGVNSTLLTEMNNEDIKVDYHFLSKEDATYVGLAKDYQETLIEKAEINLPELLSTQTLQIDFLMSETVPSILGTKNLTMTSLSSAQMIINDLTTMGINDIFITLKGWNKGGYSGTTPVKIKFNPKVGNKRNFINWFKELKNNNHIISVYNDYITGGEKGNYRFQTDVAKSNKRTKISYKNDSLPLYTNWYYLYPESSLEIGLNDIKKYQNLSITDLSLDNLGYNLFSYYNKEDETRSNAAKAYQELLNNLANEFNLALYQPNTYTWQYCTRYLGMTLYSNAYKMYTDTIPLIPYILKGYLPYYSDYVNFNAIGQDQYLRLLDYGAYPSYLLTEEISHKLKYTNSNSYYTTAYEDWKDSIITNYLTYNEAYVATLNCKVINREVLKTGIVCVTYQNISTLKTFNIYLNYTENDFILGDIMVKANSYLLRRDV